MKKYTLIALTLSLCLGLLMTACSDDGPADGALDAGVDAPLDDTGDVDAGKDVDDAGDVDDIDTGEADAPEPDDATDVDDTGQDADDAGDIGDTDDAGDADVPDTGEPSPPDDLDPLPGHWSADYSVPGIVSSDGGVVTALLYDEPTDEIYVAGDFTHAGTALADNVAYWNGFHWQPMGQGLPITAHTLVKDASGDIYAAGSAGGGGGIGIGPSSNDIHVWDGNQWSAFAQVEPASSSVNAMELLPTGQLLVAGDFQAVEGVSANNLALWDGTNWSPVGAANEPDGAVTDIAAIPNGLCAAGDFDHVGTRPADGVACWDGSGWRAIGDGIDGEVNALIYLGGGEFLAGGRFSIEETHNNQQALTVGLAKFDGTSWSGHAGGVRGGHVTDVRTLHKTSDGIYVGGTFRRVGHAREYSANIARLRNGTWTTLDLGVAERSRVISSSVEGVNAVAVKSDGTLVAGGFFTEASGAFAPNLARWDAATWEPMVNLDAPYLGADGVVKTFASGDDGTLYVGGSFSRVGPYGGAGVAYFDGLTWREMGEGLEDGDVRTLAVDGTTVYAGGEFEDTGPNTVSYIAQWDGSAWQPIGTGVNAAVHDLAVGPNGELYAVGAFTNAGGQHTSGVAVWDGTAWSSMNDGFADIGPGQDSVNAVAVDENGDVYVGGTFVETAQNDTVMHLARWDNNRWVDVGGGVRDHDPNTGDRDDLARVFDLAFWDGDLVVAGNFAEAGATDAYSIALFDGTSFEALGSGIPPRQANGRPGTVFSVAPKHNGLFIATNQRELDSQQVGYVAWWDGADWHAVDEGVDDVTEVVFVHQRSLYVGGALVGAGGEASFHLARWVYGNPVD